ncbi:hypothetical protein OC835_004138 [Tilletia horrida]|nr:hypothetical protein OC835_004138 [Tilletia horrida]
MWTQFALLLVISQLFSGAILASPLSGNEDSDESFGLLTRGHLKFAGSPCVEDSECFSDRCVTDGFPNGEPTPFTCHRQQPGGHCASNANCQTRLCDTSSGTCQYAALNGRCFELTDCYGWLDGSQTCSKGRCRLRAGQPCKKSGQCQSGFCSNKVCRERPQAPNAPCQIDSECLSGSCLSIPYDQCTNPDGSFTTCPGASNNCARYPSGHACANTGECINGTCRDSICVTGQDGDACSEQYQCSGICGGDGKCFTPAPGTLNSNSVCQTDVQCVSGRCTADQLQKDYNGVKNVVLQDLSPTRCDYLSNGESGCRSFRDCSTGICKDGTCQLGLDGDRCLVNYNCEHLCGLDGVCFTPAQPQGKGAPCTSGDQCLSNDCTKRYNSVYRPPLDGDPSWYPSLTDTVCSPSNIGGGCNVNADCGQGGCSSDKVCGLLPLGAECARSSQCDSQQCVFHGDTDTGTCALASPFTPCSRNDQCLSGSCIEQSCRYRRDFYYGGYCDPVVCATSPVGGACRTDDDCDSRRQSCSAMQTCLTQTDIPCSANAECLSNICSAGLCADVPVSTTTTTSTSTSTSDPTSTSSTTTSTSTTLDAPTSDIASTPGPTSMTSSSTTSSSSKKTKSKTSTTTKKTSSTTSKTTKSSSTKAKASKTTLSTAASLTSP